MIVRQENDEILDVKLFRHKKAGEMTKHGNCEIGYWALRSHRHIWHSFY